MSRRLLNILPGLRPAMQSKPGSKPASTLGLQKFPGLQKLPAFQDQMRIFLHPQQVVVVRSKRNSARQVIDKTIVSCASDASVESGVALWSPAVAALAKTLRDNCWQGADPQLVLSNHFVRYALIPWNDGLANQSERDAYLRHSFHLVYGDAARGWDLRLSHNGVNQAAVASGIEPALLQDINTAFGTAGFNVSAIYPHLMIGINHAQQQLSQTTYWFVLVEQGRVCIAMIRDGLWLSVKSFAVGRQPEAQIAAAIEREAIICGIDTADWPLAVYWPGRMDMPVLDDGGRSVVWVKPVDNASLTGSLPVNYSKNYSASHAANQVHDEDYDAAMWA